MCSTFVNVSSMFQKIVIQSALRCKLVVWKYNNSHDKVGKYIHKHILDFDMLMPLHHGTILDMTPKQHTHTYKDITKLYCMTNQLNTLRREDLKSTFLFVKCV